MILRKPYAFFIKIFKPIHFVMAIIIAYLIFLENNILTFLNSYISSPTTVITDSIKENLTSNLLFILPIILIFFCLIVLGVMFRKKKPVAFYVVSIFSFIVVIVINLYAFQFLNVMQESIVAIKSVKLIHDLVLINIMIETVSFVFFVIRGIGINFKKFDFNSDISKFNINESDKEEVEINIEVDLNEAKRKRRKRLRHLKYFYIENKFLINLISAIVIVLVCILVFVIVKLRTKPNTEGNFYSTSSFSFSVEETFILNTDYRGNKITDNHLIVVNTKIRSNYASNSLYLKDFSLSIGEVMFKPTTKYSDLLVDIGNPYSGSILSNEYVNYIFVFEIPEKYTTSEMLFGYNDEGNRLDIKLNPKGLTTNEKVIENKITDEVSFEESLGDIKLKINSYEISNKFLIEYNYCVKENDCLSSKEYLKPSINTNFDKIILKLNIKYEDNSELNNVKFYEFFSKFGSIYYKIEDKWYFQKGNFEEIASKKKSAKDDVYIGINSNIMNANSIKLVFNIRGIKYEYLLK